jgi:hypothetical protein
MSAEKIIQKIKRTRAPLQDLHAPSLPGIYAIFLIADVPFPVEPGQDGLIYVGSSGDLATRDFGTHFSSGQSGFSTLRRSIEAILKEELDLTAIPRGKGPPIRTIATTGSPTMARIALPRAREPMASTAGGTTAGGTSGSPRLDLAMGADGRVLPPAVCPADRLGHGLGQAPTLPEDSGSWSVSSPVSIRPRPP